MKQETQLHCGPLFKGVNKAIGGNPSRPAFSYAQIKQGFLYATNAHVAIKIDLKKFYSLSDGIIEILNGKYLPKEMIIELSKIKKKEFVKIDSNGFHLNFKSLLFKDFDDVYPDIDKVILDDSKQESLDRFNINAFLLADIYDIYNKEIGNIDGLIINTFGKNKHLKIQNDDKSFVAILMPKYIH